MTKLKSVTFQNFQSYGSVPSSVTFSDHGTTMITGNNQDDGGSNGTGKSTIINALAYGLYDKPVSDISKDGLINNINGKNMEVIVEFDKGDHSYKVRRYRKMKGNGIELFEDGVDITPDSITNTNAMIERIIDMPYELFVRVIVFSAINTQFLNLPMRDQANTLEDLLDLKMLSDKSSVLKERIKDTTRSMEIEDEHIIQSNKDCHRFITQYERAYDRATEWETNRTNQVNKAIKEIEVLTDRNIHKELELQINLEKACDTLEKTEQSVDTIKLAISHENELSEELDILTKQSADWGGSNAEEIKKSKAEIETLSTVNVQEQLTLLTTLSELVSEKDVIVKSITDYKKDISSTEKIIKENNEELTHLSDNKCPYCKQHLDNTKSRIKLAEKMISESTEMVESTNELISKCDSDLQDLNDAIANTKDKIEYTNDELQEITANTVNAQTRLDIAENATNEYLPQVARLEKKVDKTVLLDLTDELKKLMEVLSSTQDEIDAIRKSRTLTDAEIDTHNVKLATAETKLHELKEQVNGHNEQLIELSTDKFNEEDNVTFMDIFEQCDLPTDKPPEMFSKIRNSDDKYVFITGTTRSNELHKLLDHQKFLLKLLTNKNSFIRKTMLNQSIPFLNKQLDGYLKMMGLPHSVSFTPKMEINISRLGKSLQYGNLSNGQACRVNLALSFAFRDVLQYLHDPINVWILDEVLDVGLDSGGIQQAAAMIKQKSKADKSSIFVISHRDEIAQSFDNVITVTLKDSFSAIK